MAQGFTVIEKGVFDGSTAAVDFTSIPSTYSHLEISCTTNSDQSAANRASISLTINGDTGSNYGYLGVAQSSGSGDLGYNMATSSSAPLWMGNGPGDAVESGEMIGSLNMWFWNYADTTFHKTFYSSSGYAAGTTYVAMEQGGIWRNTAAINQVKLEVYSGGGEVGVSGCQYMLGAWT